MEKYYIATLNAVNLFGSARCRQLIETFGSAEKVWRAEIPELEEAKLKSNLIDSLINFRQEHPDAVEQLIDFCESKNVKLCSFYDEDYPPLLKEIQNPPVVFYYRGNIKPLAERIAIVGTRRNTSYGEKAAQNIASELAEAGITVVSGAAVGIDTCAHRGALKHGRTVAVLGHGIAKKPLRETKKLLDEIIESGGVVMTEFSPGTNAAEFTFPIRNRVVAGLCRGVLVVEAGKKSGALITSTHAADFGRDVFAVPGNIFYEKSYGCNELIRDGATLIKNAKDILEFYNFPDTKKSAAPLELNDIEQKIFDMIPTGEFITIDEILMNADDIEPEEISQIILQLEIKKCIVEQSDGYTKA